MWRMARVVEPRLASTRYVALTPRIAPVSVTATVIRSAGSGPVEAQAAVIKPRRMKMRWGLTVAVTSNRVGA